MRDRICDNNDRIVRGFDRLVLCSGDNTPPTIVEINHPYLTRGDLRQKYKAKYQFLVNKNLHNAFKNMRGMLCFVQKKIALIHTCVGVKATCVQILPLEGQGSFFEIDLKTDFGFYLEYLGEE